MDTSSGQSPYFLAYKAAQVKLGDKGFLSRDITVQDLVMNRSDAHHVYPRNYLKKQGLARGQPFCGRGRTADKYCLDRRKHGFFGGM